MKQYGKLLPTLHPALLSPLTHDNPRMKATMVSLANYKSNAATVVRHRGSASSPAASNSSPPSSSSIHSAVRPLIEREIEQPRVF